MNKKLSAMHNTKNFKDLRIPDLLMVRNCCRQDPY